MKKIFLLLMSLYFIFVTQVFATGPGVVCTGLPGCSSGNTSVSGKGFFSFLGRFISEMINYVAVISVISIVIAGIMYLTSGGEDEQVKKAKKWITWSLIGVFISTSAWAFVNLVNSLKIN